MYKVMAALLCLMLMYGCGKSDETMCIETATQKTTAESTAQTEDNIVDDGRTYIADGFSYGDINEDVKKRITGVSLPEKADISASDLSYIRILHYDFDRQIKDGELIVNKKVAKEVTEIFYELYKAEYPMSSVKLIDEFDADDEKSMTANNTSAFNYRTIAGSNKLSMHGRGLAVDINPLYNPCVTKNGISPSSASTYADRSSTFPGKIDKNDLAYKLFTAKGWQWGGNWNSLKDYQHFEKQL